MTPDKAAEIKEAREKILRELAKMYPAYPSENGMLIADHPTNDGINMAITEGMKIGMAEKRNQDGEAVKEELIGEIEKGINKIKTFDVSETGESIDVQDAVKLKDVKELLGKIRGGK